MVAGIGPTTAALCATDLAKCLGPKFKELIYSGTSGWSSAVGGILNADDCKKATSSHKVSFEYHALEILGYQTHRYLVVHCKE